MKPIEKALRAETRAFRYQTTDLHASDVDLPGEDIQALSFQDSSYDLVLCNHVIEHVEDDLAAISELRRILTPSGIAAFTIPGDWGRERTLDFGPNGPNGHYRDYGNDVIEKFKRRFQFVAIVDLASLQPSEGPLYGIRQGDLLFLCSESPISI